MLRGSAIDLARGNGGAVGRLNHVDDALRTAVIRQTQRHGHIFGGSLRIGNAHSLIGPKEEQLVLDNRPADGSAKSVPVQERTRQIRLIGDRIDAGSIVEVRRGVHIAVLPLFP